ncbi:DNA-processing protein DprA [Mycobacterium sp. MYCO198283]|uniref:DNA-processing protein DprA n=1 Tax=Mycobacterium sp. MYCO198283 TaxID=2883505 RepID=UPI001E430F39|nr:DNA-processing protein DprA [Mycobacterium sp. MYCO198283]MCG5433748.1 DNA-processing protein DprA [Mycobacterium sp. MYCO198283]
MTSDTEAWAYLSRVVEPPCAELVRLVAQVGCAEAAARIRRGEVAGTLQRLTAARRHIDTAAADLTRIEAMGGRLVTPDDDEWPVLAFSSFGLVDAEEYPNGIAPLALWVNGPARLDDIAARAAALVGTRAATAYGEQVAADMAAELVGRDVAVVSGGAYGIDGAAHRAALGAGGVTAAVVAGGVDVPYPAGHAALLRRVAVDGAVVSEYPPGVRPARHRFLVRNRLVAALSGVTVVVEAGLRSGAANTAAWAHTLNRPVGAVPGPVTSSASAGCHRLIRNHATLVTRADEVVELCGRIGELADDEPHPTTPLDGLSAEEKRVYEALPGRGARTCCELAVESGLPVAQVQGRLAMLELAGLAATTEDGRWRLMRRPRAG